MNSSSPHRRAPVRRYVELMIAPLRSQGSPVFWLSAALLAVALIFGGQSRDNPLSTMAIELVGVMVLTALAWPGSPMSVSRKIGPEMVLVVAMFLIPIVQLVPLPPDIWMSLPGRREVAESLALAGLEGGWAPISLDPESTFRCLLWLVPPAALFLAVGRLDTDARFRLAGIVLLLGIVSLILGGLQVADRDGVLFASPAGGHADLPIGFFANRNHQGIAMVVALPFAAACAARWGSAFPQRTRTASIAFVTLLALLLMGVLGTRSRAALVLAGPALVVSVGLFWSTFNTRRVRREAALIMGAAAVVLVSLAQFAISAVLDRFGALTDNGGRYDIWSTTIRAGADVSPVGSGLGTFVPFYRAREALELMGPQYINHAHNDYLELWLETGWLGPSILVAFCLWFGFASLKACIGPASPAAMLARASVAAVLVLLAHSIGDYPLRTQALACIFAFAAACSVGRRQST